MDVDKWDYLMRDCFHIGMGQGCSVLDLERFLRFYRPAEVVQGGQEVGWHLCFRDSEMENVLRVFNNRLHLHRQIYSHKTSTEIEVDMIKLYTYIIAVYWIRFSIKMKVFFFLKFQTMLLDVCSELDPVLHLRTTTFKSLTSDDNSDYLSKYLRFDEVNLWAMASNAMHWTCNASSDEEKDSLDRAQRLCQRIQMRHLYTMVGTIYATTDSKTSNGDIRQPISARQQARESEFTASIAVSDKYSAKQTAPVPFEVILPILL